MPVDVAPDSTCLGSEGERRSWDAEGGAERDAESSEADAAGGLKVCEAAGSEYAGFP